MNRRTHPTQRQLMRIVRGAVKNTADAHPGWNINPEIATSIAKRAAGTLRAQWLEVLAARSVPSDEADGLSAIQGHRPPGGRTGCQGRPGRRAARLTHRRSPLPLLWQRISARIKPAKIAGRTDRVETLIEVCKLIAELQRSKSERE